MNLPGEALSANTSSAVIQRLAVFGGIIVIVALICYLLIYLASSNRTLMAGRPFGRIMTTLRRVLLLEPSGGDGEIESKGVAFIRVSFGILWIVDAIMSNRANAPANMISDYISPALVNQPSPISWVMRAGLYLWRFDPVGASVAKFWLEASIGILMLFASRGPLRKVVGWLAISMGAITWIFVEGFGMLATNGASFFSGAPGGGLLYLLGGVLLLVPSSRFRDGTVQRWARLTFGLFWFLMALVQALPSEGFWSASGLSGIFRVDANLALPSFISGPMAFMATATSSSASLWNLIFIVSMVLVGLGIAFAKENKGFAFGSIAITLVAWWVGMAFGIFVPYAVDPNSPLPLIVLTIGLIVISGDALVPSRRVVVIEEEYRRDPRGFGITAGLIGALVAIVPIMALLPSAAASASYYGAVADGGGLVATNKSAPNFSLVDQNGSQVTMGTFANKVVVASFVDPVAWNVSATMVKEMLNSLSSLGSAGKNVAILLIDINPSFTSAASIDQFLNENGLGSVRNLYFVTGPLSDLYALWKQYSASPAQAPIGRVANPQLIYFIDGNGREVGFMEDSGSSQASLVKSYENFISATLGVLHP
ncbi:SCO family protein [Acidithrix ferrooxidans]|uniref:Uncharacterized protein n=1 Tax=Acidithrix ferrooxidans TaxID=1280514 RepID=A0A0D8HH12_9ACTN|nr:SCO family protein [Acidithrix ferrooxidans]KJF16341.1 hypothetical protein AXFE_27860 [Acidithrix ferrooxidans]